LNAQENEAKDYATVAKERHKSTPTIKKRLDEGEKRGKRGGRRGREAGEKGRGGKKIRHRKGRYKK